MLDFWSACPSLYVSCESILVVGEIFIEFVHTSNVLTLVNMLVYNGLVVTFQSWQSATGVHTNWKLDSCSNQENSPPQYCSRKILVLKDRLSLDHSACKIVRTSIFRRTTLTMCYGGKKMRAADAVGVIRLLCAIRTLTTHAKISAQGGAAWLAQLFLVVEMQGYPMSFRQESMNCQYAFLTYII